MSGSWSAQNTWAKVVEIAAVLGVILAVVFSLKSCSQADEANQRDSLNLVFGGGIQAVHGGTGWCMTSIALVANEGRMPRTVVAVAVPEHPEMKVTFRSFPVASAADEGVLSPDQPFTVAPNDSTVIMLQVPGLTIPTYVRPDGGPAYQALLNDGTKVWLPLRKSSARENIPQAVLNRASQVAREANCSTS